METNLPAAIAAIGANIKTTNQGIALLDSAIDALANGTARAYLTYAALDADKATLPTNSFARVTNDPNPDNNWLWQWNGTTLTKSDRDEVAIADAKIDPLTEAVTNILTTAGFNGINDELGRKYIFALINAARVGFGVTNDLDVVWNGTKVQSSFFGNFVVDFNAKDELGNRYAFALVNPTTSRIAFGVTDKAQVVIAGAKTSNGRGLFSVTDKAGRAAIYVTPSGKVYIPELVGYSNSSEPDPQEKADRIAADIQMLPVVWADINHAVFNGQSLSVGSESVPIISTSQPYQNVMITSGVRPALGEADYNGSALVPLVELIQVSNPSVGESPVSGTLNGFVARIVAAGGTAESRVMLGTTSGVGSRRVEQLLDEANFVRVRNHIAEAKRLATAAGKSYAVTAICYAQGESDIGAGGSGNTRFTDYYRRYLQLITNTRQVAIEASGQSFVPCLFSYQTSGHQSYNKQTLQVPLAQWRASVALKDVVLATPSYRMPCAPDNLHLTNEGSWLLGQYFARAMFWTFELGQKWRPLEPIDVTWSSTQIDIKYHVPCKPIQLSTAICTAVTNSGYDIWTASNTLISNAIDSVTVLNDDTVRITLNPSATIPADAVLSYGRSRAGNPVTSGPLNNPPCGNLIDSHGLYDTVTAPTTGTVYPLTNVGVLFQYRRASGFH